MILDISRPIKNSEKVIWFLRECCDMAAKNSDLINNDTFTVKKIEFEISQSYLELKFLQNLKNVWNKYSNGKKVFIHELLSGSDLYLPKYEPPARNAELDARIERIKAQLDEAEYQRMVSNVDLNSPLRHKDKVFTPNTSLFPEFKTVQGQLIAIFNVFAVIGGSFVFGYKAIEYSLNEPNITKQVMGGLVLAIIVAIADFYFLFKKLLRVEKSELRQEGALKRKTAKKSTDKKEN